MHNPAYCGHVDGNRAYQNVEQLFWWPQLRNETLLWSLPLHELIRIAAHRIRRYLAVFASSVAVYGRCIRCVAHSSRCHHSGAFLILCLTSCEAVVFRICTTEWWFFSAEVEAKKSAQAPVYWWRCQGSGLHSHRANQVPSWPTRSLAERDEHSNTHNWRLLLCSGIGEQVAANLSRRGALGKASQRL